MFGHECALVEDRMPEHTAFCFGVYRKLVWVQTCNSICDINKSVQIWIVLFIR